MSSHIRSMRCRPLKVDWFTIRAWKTCFLLVKHMKWAPASLCVCISLSLQRELQGNLFALFWHLFCTDPCENLGRWWCMPSRWDVLAVQAIARFVDKDSLSFLFCINYIYKGSQPFVHRHFIFISLLRGTTIFFVQI